MQERRKQRETEFEQRQQEKEKERVEAARAKEKDHEERMAALNAMQQQHIEDLQKKIQQKVYIIWIVILLFMGVVCFCLGIRNVHNSVCCTHFSQQQDESARRHKENIDQKKEKAFEMTVLKHSTEDQKDAPKLAPYSTKKFCTVCNVLVRTSVSLVL